MADKLKIDDLRLRAGFLDKGNFLEERNATCLMAEIQRGSAFAQRNTSHSSFNDMMGTENDEEDCVDNLACQMANSFIAEDHVSSHWRSRVLATSPQSKVSITGFRSASCMENQSGGLKLSSRRSMFLDQRNDDAMDLLFEAAGEILRKKQIDQRCDEHGLRSQHKFPFGHIKPSTTAGIYGNRSHARQQLQAAQFYKLKRQQLIKQNLSSGWNRPNRESTMIAHRPHGSSSFYRSSLLEQQYPGSRMKPLLRSPGSRRESAGTGVFLPRRTDIPAGKFHACPTVILPERMEQSHRQTINLAGARPHFPRHISDDHHVSSAGSESEQDGHERNIYQSSPDNLSGHEIRLPNEWTY